MDKLNKQPTTDPVVDLLPSEILTATFSSNIYAKEITQTNLDVLPGSTRVTRATARNVTNQITNVDEAIKYKKCKKPISIQIISKNSTNKELDQQGVRTDNTITAITTGTENITTTIIPEMEKTTTTVSTKNTHEKNKAVSKYATTNKIEKQGERTGKTTTTTLNSGTEKTKTTSEMVKTTITITIDDLHKKNKARNKDATINEKDKQVVRTDNTTTIQTQEKENTTTIITPKMEKITTITKDDPQQKNISGNKMYQMKQTPININNDNRGNINMTEMKNSYTLHSSQEPGPSKHISDREMEEINKAIREADRVERYGKEYEQWQIKAAKTRQKAYGNGNKEDKGKHPMKGPQKIKSIKDTSTKNDNNSKLEIIVQNKQNSTNDNAGNTIQKCRYTENISKNKDNNYNQQTGDSNKQKMYQKHQQQRKMGNHQYQYHAPEHTIFIASTTERLLRISNRSLANALIQQHGGEFRIVRPRKDYIIIQCNTLKQVCKYMEITTIAGLPVKITRHKATIKNHNNNKTSTTQDKDKSTQRQYLAYQVKYKAILKLPQTMVWKTQENIEYDLRFHKINCKRVVKLRNHLGMETSTILLEFQQPPPTHVSIGPQGTKVKLQQYINKPRYCKNCCKWGHFSSRCRSHPRCGKCGGKHTGTCFIKIQKCANCRADHKSYDTQCPIAVQEKVIIRLMDQQNISYNQAKKQHMQKEIIPKAKKAEAQPKPNTTEQNNYKDSTRQALNQEQTLLPPRKRNLDTTANPEIFLNRTTIDTYLNQLQKSISNQMRNDRITKDEFISIYMQQIQDYLASHQGQSSTHHE